MHIRRTSACLAPVLAIAAGAAAQDYELHVVEALSTFGTPEAYLWDVNTDAAAVGMMTYTVQLPSGSYSTNYKGFRWTESGGPEVFTNVSSIGAINDPGDMVVGETILWAGGGSSVVPAIPGYPQVFGSEINDHGLFVGRSHWKSVSCCSYDKAIYWTQAAGTFDLSLVIPFARVAVDANNLGQVVGIASLTASSVDKKAFLYDTVTGVHTDLHAMLTGGGPGITEASAINNLGVVAGEGYNGSFISGWVWDPGAGFTFLPALKNGDRDRNHPTDINDDGAVVGYAATNGSSDWHAFIWDATNGIRDLNDLVDLPAGFILDRALSISNSGVIVGDGHWGPGWGPAVAWVLTPIDTCYADCDRSGALDLFDFLCFANAFNAGDPYADCDGSGGLDLFDFLCFTNAFNAGCP